MSLMRLKLIRRGDRAVEGARLESVCARKGTAGSNPALSAKRRPKFFGYGLANVDS
jgi:hypothetical protein